MQPFRSVLVVAGGGVVVERGVDLARTSGARSTLLDVVGPEVA